MTARTKVVRVDREVTKIIATSPAGPQGVGVPPGGSSGQALVKTGNGDFATGWSSAEADTRAAADIALDGRLDTVEATLPLKADLVGGLVPVAQIPPVAMSDYLGDVASQAAMLALVGQRGDWCTRSDLESSFIVIAEPSSLIGNWKKLTTPSDAVSSVNGRIGAVVGLAEQSALTTEVAARIAADAAHEADTTNIHGIVETAALVVTTDPRLSDQRTPVDGSVTDAKVAGVAAIAESKLALASDAAAGTPSRRTLGTGATQAAAGNDARLSDQRVPTDGSVTLAKLAFDVATQVELDAEIARATAAEATKETPAGAQAKADAKVADAISDGTTTVAPSQNAVFDALALKAPLASPTFTGTPAAPTPAQGTNTTQLATTAYVQTESGLLVPKSVLTTDGDLLTRAAGVPARVTRAALAADAAFTAAFVPLTDPRGWGIAFTVAPNLRTTESAVGLANRAHYLRSQGGMTATKIAAYLGVSSGAISAGVLRGPGGTGAPTSRTATSGAIACPSAGYAEISMGGSVVIDGHLDYLCLSADNNTATFSRAGSLGVNAAFAAGIDYVQDTAHPLPSAPAGTARADLAFILVGVA